MGTQTDPDVEQYLAGIHDRCRRLTAEDMVRALESEMDRHRRGYGHYLFQLDRPPLLAWSVPGALSYELEPSEGGYDVVIDVCPFDKEDVSVEVEPGLLVVTAEHRDKREGGRGVDAVARAQRRFTLPPGTRAEDVKATLKEGELRIRVPTPKRKRVKVTVG